MNYRISRRADADIAALCEYIARDNSEAANRLDERLYHAIGLLAQFPGMGHMRADVQDQRYRF